MGSFGQNLNYAARQLVRNPGFALTVILTLAFSIGANTAIFSIVNAILLKSLPYDRPERMGTIFTQVEGAHASNDRRELEGERWELLRDNVPSLISAVSDGGANGVNLKSGNRAQYVHSGRVSAHYFDVLAIHPLLGRSFSDVEDRPHGPAAAILSYDLWRTTFAGDRNLIGQTIQLKDEPYTVVGVLPKGVTTPTNADLYTPLQPSRSGEGDGTNFDLIVRLKDGATWQRADAELNRAWASAAWTLNRNKTGRVIYYSVPFQKGVAAPLRPKAMILMMASGFILLIACANLAGLTLVRMTRRLPEMATRLALGATRWQMQKQLWVENLLLAALGGLAGIGIGFVGLRGLLSLLPENFLPVADVPLDLRVLAFTGSIALLTSILFGMLPALAVSRINLRASIASRAGAGSDRLHLRQGLIAGEVALTVVLLACSGLLIRTLVHLQTLPPGFNADGVLAAKASLDEARYHNPAEFMKLVNESIDAMRRIPGVEDAAMGLTLPYERPINGGVTLRDGPDAGQQVGTNFIYVAPGYFKTLQIQMLAGRDFTVADGPKTQRVAIINRTFAQKFFPGVNPVGHTLDKGTRIIGVVADTQLTTGLSANAPPLLSEETEYIPAAQVDAQLLSMAHLWLQPSWIVRSSRPVDGLVEQMQIALASVDPGLPFSGFYSMNDLMAKSLSSQRIQVALLGTMAGLALLLSAVGIFSLVANLVAQRTREIGIRIALGSTVRQAMMHVGGSGVFAAGLGLVAGLCLCAITLRAMHSVLYGVGVYDATTLGGVVLMLAAITLLATVLPTIRIARIDPATTLREE